MILCGAGFSEAKQPEKPLPFPVFGVAGVEDFNWIELRQLHRRWIQSAPPINSLLSTAITRGRRDFCLTAVEWMELQAMKSGRRERDDKLIAGLFDKLAGEARADESAKRVYEAFLKYEAIAKDFKGLREAPEFAKRADELRSSSEVKDRLKQEKTAEQSQRRLSQEFYAARERLNTAENPAVAIMDVRHDLRFANESRE